MTFPAGSDESWLSQQHRLLVVDDNPAIHDDFRKILGQSGRVDGDFERLDQALFSDQADAPASVSGLRFAIDFAGQGHEGLERVQAACAAERPYALVFLDVRMPPGWNGVETAARILHTDPNVQIVLCTAYSDFGWNQIVDVVGATDRVLILKKPFSVIEVQQLAYALVMKWLLVRASVNHREVLEARVAERTDELVAANQRLRAEMAERSRMEAALRKAQRLESLGRLAAGIGHEINNPLNFISGSIEIVQNEIDGLADVIPEGQRGTIDDVLDAASVGIARIASIVRSIKLFSRSPGEPASSIELADTLAMCLKMSLQRLPIQVELELDFGDIPPVWCDRVELEQVFINIIENAVHAMRDAEVEAPRIAVTTRRDEDHTVRVEIADSGPGVDPALLEQIFDPFFTTKAPGVGTGLGLSICHSIIENMGGTIEMKNADAGGAVVVVRLPCIDAASAATAVAEPDAPAGEALGDAVDAALDDDGFAQPVPTPRGRVLLIDDEPLMLRVMTHTLREHELVTADSAQEALKHCEAQDFDVIFCDVMMPTMNGLSFYRELAHLRPGYEQRIVFITGGARVAGIQEFLDEVANDCLAKPVSTEALLARVKRALLSKSDRGDEVGDRGEA